MTNKLVFEIETEAPYSAEEIESLKDAFADFILNDVEDQDADGSSAEVRFIPDFDDEDEKSEDDKIRDKAIELLKNGGIIANLVFVDEDNNELFEADDVKIDLS